MSLSCEDVSWLASYEQGAKLGGQPITEDIQVKTLAHKAPYLLSFYFSAATLTSAGFGGNFFLNRVSSLCTSCINNLFLYH